MADVSLVDPYSAQQESIARRRRMAQALQQQAQTPLETPQMPGVLISPYAGLAKVLQGFVGGYQEAEAAKEYKALGEEARKNQSEDLAKVLGAVRAPARPEIAGQEAVMDMPERIIPGQTISQYGGTLNIPEQIIPKVAYQPAIEPQPARPAGYISPELIAEIKDPTARNLALAQLIKQTEPETFIKGSPGDVFYDRLGNKKFSIPAAAAKGLNPEWKEDSRQINGKTVAGWINVNAENPASSFVAGGKPEKIAAHWEATTQQVNGKPVAGWINLNAADKAASFVAGAKPTETKAATPHWVVGQKDVNGTTQFGWYDLNAADKDASFKAGANPPAGEKSNWKEVTRGNQVFYEDFNVADPAKRQAGAIAKEAVKTPTHYSEIEDKGNIVIVDMNLPADQRLAKGQIKGPIRNNLEKITTTDANNREVTRYVDKALLATMGDIPAPYKGFMSDLAEAGQLPANWQSIPQIAGLVRENLINKAGGMTQADLASLKVRIAEAAAKLAYEGVSGFSTKDLTPTLPNFTTLPSQYPTASSTPAAAGSKITTRAEIAEAAKRANKSIEEVTRDAVQKGFRVQ